jgi:xanthine dehydrogenase accessory factor
MNDETLNTAADWEREGHKVALAQVVRTYKSAPRPVGAIFAVSSHGKMAGSVSGGCVEGAIYGEAQELFAGAATGPQLLHYGISDELAGDVGLACGGELWVSLDLLRDRPQLRRGAIATAVAGPQAGRRLVLDVDADRVDSEFDGQLHAASLEAAQEASDEEASRALDLGEDGMVFVEAVHPPHRVVVVGAVDTAEHVCRLAGQLGWRSVVIDPRVKFATRERLPSAGEIVGKWPQEAYPEIGLERADSVVVLTHDPKVDDPAIAAALAAGVGYVGALGSRRTQGLRNERLVENGVPAEDAERIYGPVGLDIGAHTPAETAVSIVAELIAHRSGRSGKRLVATTGRIHPTDETEA